MRTHGGLALVLATLTLIVPMLFGCGAQAAPTVTPDLAATSAAATAQANTAQANDEATRTAVTVAQALTAAAPMPTTPPEPPNANATSIPPTATSSNTAIPQPRANASGTLKPTAEPSSETSLPILTPKPEEVPIADLHFHPDPLFPPFVAKQLMNRNGVQCGGLGAKGMNPLLWAVCANALGNQYIAFAGQVELNQLYLQTGIAAMGT